MILRLSLEGAEKWAARDLRREDDTSRVGIASGRWEGIYMGGSGCDSFRRGVAEGRGAVGGPKKVDAQHMVQAWPLAE